jgi:predicted metal-dependent hydrolase
MRKSRGKGSVRYAALDVGGMIAPVEVRRHPSARRLTLHVHPTRRAVVVTVPQRCKLDEANSFVHRHLDWVRDRLGNLPDPIPFAEDARIPLRGVMHAIGFADPDGQSPIVAAERSARGHRLIVRGRREHAPRRLRDWLIGEARSDLDQRVVWHARRLGLRARRITVRDQSSRWGSCSSTGQLSFSWRLILAPPLVLDYVAAHEVAHLAEMNHGERFWALVEKTMPEMEEAKRWLRRNGHELHRYGAE